jgi:hypothetical protein
MSWALTKVLSFCHQIGGNRRTQQGCRLAPQDLDEKEKTRKNPKKREEQKNKKEKRKPRRVEETHKRKEHEKTQKQDGEFEEHNL